MKTEELKRIAKENDYTLSRPFGDFTFIKKGGENYINISGDAKNRIWLSIEYNCDEKDFNMIKAAVEFAETPLEEREEEKEFYLKHRWIKGCVIMYLYRNTLNGYCYLGDKKCRPHRQKRFTLKEIEEIKEKYDTKLEDFEIVEVEE